MVFQFASLQSEFGQRTVGANEIDDTLKTVVLLKNSKVYVRSDAALEIVRELNGFWSGLYYLRFIPRFIRDAVYDFISQRRYKWFGRTDECWLPSRDLSSRFVD
jgi:predicted DCC family thiol-disulfide oxidoreductase YuxK